MLFLTPVFRPNPQFSDDVILRHPAAWVGYSAKAKTGLGRYFGSFKPPYYASNFLSLLEFWDVFLMQFVLIAHSYIFLICSNPGLANLSCTVKTLLFICFNKF
jgi:hypothetical protein